MPLVVRNRHVEEFTWDHGNRNSECFNSGESWIAAYVPTTFMSAINTFQYILQLPIFFRRVYVRGIHQVISRRFWRSKHAIVEDTVIANTKTSIYAYTPTYGRAWRWGGEEAVCVNGYAITLPQISYFCTNQSRWTDSSTKVIWNRFYIDSSWKIGEDFSATTFLSTFYKTRHSSI